MTRIKVGAWIFCMIPATLLFAGGGLIEANVPGPQHAGHIFAICGGMWLLWLCAGVFFAAMISLISDLT